MTARVALALLLLAAAGGGAAQELPGWLRVGGEVRVGTEASVGSQGGAPDGRLGVTLRLHLDLGAEVPLPEGAGTLEAIATLDPYAVVPPPFVGDAPLAEPGLTELYALWRQESVDLSAGVERLPLETARLSVPFSVERRTALGQPQGVLGVRATAYPGDWRLRAAALYRDGEFGGAVSARREFGGVDLEAHAVYLDGFAFGLGGSGLVGDVVVYGEGWLLLPGPSARGALGASGYLGDGLWTLEAAYAPAAAGSGVAGGDEPFPRLAGSLSLPLDELNTLDVAVGAGLAPDGAGTNALQLAADVGYAYALPDGSLGVGTSLAHGAFGTRYALRLVLTGYF